MSEPTTNPNHAALELLDGLNEFYSRIGLATQRTTPSPSVPIHILQVRFESLGRGEQPVDLGFSFVPLPPEVTASGLHILQSMAELSDDVKPEQRADLLWMIARLNTHLPIGFFGLMEERRVLYFKHNAVVDLSSGRDANVRLVDRQSGVMLHALGLLMDGVLDVARGLKSARAALAEGPFAELFRDAR